MKSGRDEAARGSILGSSPRPDREHRKPQPTTCYIVACVKTAVEISEESPLFRVFRWIPWLISDPSGAATGCCWTESAVRICADLGCRANTWRVIHHLASKSRGVRAGR